MGQRYLIMRQPEIAYAVIIGEKERPTPADVKSLQGKGHLPDVTNVDASLTLTPFPQDQDDLSDRVRECAAAYPKVKLETAIISLVEV